MINKYMKFMDLACIDPKMYWRVTTQDGRDVFEIQWRRDDKSRWRFRKLGDLLWELGSDQSIISQLQAKAVDTYLFEIKLKSSLLQQVAYADRIVREAKSIMGSVEVDQAIAEQKSFLSQLEDAIATLTKLPPMSKPKLRVIKERGNSFKA